MGAAFHCSLGAFANTSVEEKIGFLAAAASTSGFATLYSRQTQAWQDELAIIDHVAAILTDKIPHSERWAILLEFEIPRRGKRPDVILIADDLIFVVEFKLGQVRFQASDVWQALSYALDLRDFHSASYGRRIVPILIATEAPSENSDEFDNDVPLCVGSVTRVGRPSAQRLAEVIERAYHAMHDGGNDPINPSDWELAPYRPVPTIIEAAEQLFAGHSVANISHAFATNLDVTSKAILASIRQAQQEHRRVICFVTGVPGAGKTLAGLNAVHDPFMRADNRPSAVFLSGNGPLVKVIREALIRDRQQAGALRSDAARTVSAFISNVHGFVATYGLGTTADPPHENAIVFDEAQRAWDANAVAKKHGISKSEPELVLEIMERSPDWAAIVALVGGGQEIHEGEAGLEEWANALSSRNSHWTVHASQEALDGGPSLAGHRLEFPSTASHLKVIATPSLHLTTSVRSPRSLRIAEWVNSVVSEGSQFQSPLDGVGEFPVVWTRELTVARKWLRERADGDQRCGLLASSGALRLRAHGIELSSGFRRAYSYEDWFLSGIDDSRSSLWLEVAATEFECQGLELDWTGVCWGGDFLRNAESTAWNYRRFRGKRWQAVRLAYQRRYIANKYRVLLTRARRGMVIWIPPGNQEDSTQDTVGFDATAKYFSELGLPAI